MGFATGKKRMAPAALAAVLALAVAGCGAKPVTVDPAQIGRASCRERV